MRGYSPQCFRAITAIVTAAGVLASPIAPILIAHRGSPQASSAPQAATPQPGDGGWPRDFVSAAGATMRVYQPQIASWDGQKRMVAFSAVSYSPKGSTKQPTLGTIKIEADTSTAVDERLVSFSQIKLTETHFPNLSNDEVRDAVARVEKLVPERGEAVIGLDRVLARLDKSTIIPKNVEGVKADPPSLFYSTSPAVLVNLDGDPIWSPIKDNDLRFAVNTNWDLFEYAPEKKYFLRYNDGWFAAEDPKGPWKPADKLPDSFGKLPADANWTDVKAAIPGRKLTSTAPKVFVSTTPAEMILLRGAPTYQLVTGTQLLWVSNTDSDLFRLGKTGPVYYLVSGRWFSAPDFTGPWTFASTSLPPDFKKIPLSHERSRVLASVPGTEQAAEAVLLAQIPQTARIDKKLVKAPDVEFQGQPEFQPIEKTTVARAVNTDKDIIKVADMYYMCYQGVWFMSKSATGPWEVTGSVPNQIYEIPVSSPAYNVTNVTVVENDNDAVVYATAAAYTGVMIAWGCAVWGTGYYYPPYIGYGGFYPVYHPYYPTYGYHASYNPWTGTYSRGVAAYGPYGGAGVGARYNPRTGTYARGAAAYGPYGSRGYASAYNPRTGAVGATRQGSNVYGSWGSTGVRRGNDWATTSHVTNRATGATTRVTQGSGGASAVTRNGIANNSGVVQTRSGDVYAGRDGNVYKKQDNGWVQQNNGQRATDAATVGQLNNDSAARAEGAQRTRDAYSSGARSGASSSYRPSSGATRSAPRGGGGRRR